MSEPLLPAEDRLIDVLSRTERGPGRNGVFALWLFVRACGGMLPPDQVSERTHRHRLQGLERRLSSLSLPPPLRRALAGGVREIDAPSPRTAAVALQQLVAPARETLGAEAGEAITLAARSAREAAKELRGTL